MSSRNQPKPAWQEKVESLARAYTGASVKLKIDEYDVAIQRERLKDTQDCFVAYVNGQFKGKWLLEDCEERRRFLRPVTRYRVNGKWRKSYQRLAKSRGTSKEFRQRYQEQLSERVTYYHLYWTSIASLIRHLVKNNTNIELVSE